MKLRDDFEKKILIEVCKRLHDGHIYSVMEGKNSGEVLGGETWFDVYDETGEIYSINIDYGWSDDAPQLSVTAYPVEEYINENGEKKLREIASGDCVVLIDSSGD